MIAILHAHVHVTGMKRVELFIWGGWRRVDVADSTIVTVGANAAYGIHLTVSTIIALLVIRVLTSVGAKVSFLLVGTVVCGWEFGFGAFDPEHAVQKIIGAALSDATLIT